MIARFIVEKGLWYFLNNPLRRMDVDNNITCLLLSSVWVCMRFGVCLYLCMCKTVSYRCIVSFDLWITIRSKFCSNVKFIFKGEISFIDVEQNYQHFLSIVRNIWLLLLLSLLLKTKWANFDLAWTANFNNDC